MTRGRGRGEQPGRSAAPKRAAPPGQGRRAGSDAAGLQARRIAADILVRVETHLAFADVLLGNRAPELAPADRRLLTRLVLGSIAWRGRLDYELAGLCTQALDKLDPPVLAALRLGLFQIRHLDRIPPHAAVDTAVTLAREAAGRGAGGFANAVLRRAAAGQISLPDRAADEIDYLTIAYSHPRWLVACMIEWFGVDRAEKLMKANNEAAPNTMRLNLVRGTRDEILARTAADGIRVRAGNRLPETASLDAALDYGAPSFREGFLQPQSESSQLVAHMLAPPPGAYIVDCAAAPGGKATHLAEMTDIRGRVVALDLNLQGLRSARDLARRLGDRKILFVNADVAAGVPLREESTGFVLLDAPCTGIGTLRSHPEIRWRLKPGDLQRMSEIQLTMLRQAAALVRPGGVIVYSVCSFAPQEGPGVVRSFLSAHPEFAIERPELPELHGLLQGDHTLATSPDRHGLDGFYAARMRRR